MSSKQVTLARLVQLEQRVSAGPPNMPPDDGHDGMTQHDTFEDWLDYRDPRGHLQSRYDEWRETWDHLKSGRKPNADGQAGRKPNTGGQAGKDLFNDGYEGMTHFTGFGEWLDFRVSLDPPNFPSNFHDDRYDDYRRTWHDLKQGENPIPFGQKYTGQLCEIYHNDGRIEAELSKLGARSIQATKYFIRFLLKGVPFELRPGPDETVCTIKVPANSSVYVKDNILDRLRKLVNLKSDFPKPSGRPVIWCEIYHNDGRIQKALDEMGAKNIKVTRYFIRFLLKGVPFEMRSGPEPICTIKVPAHTSIFDKNNILDMLKKLK